AVSDPAMGEACTTRGEIKHWELLKKIMEQDDMKLVKKRLAEIRTILGEEKAADAGKQVVETTPVLRWFLLPYPGGLKTLEEISVLLKAYREEKMKTEPGASKEYVRRVDLERALKVPFEECVKVQAREAIDLQCLEFTSDCGFRDEIHLAWARF